MVNCTTIAMFYGTLNCCHVTYFLAVQSQQTVAALFLSEQLLPEQQS